MYIIQSAVDGSYYVGSTSDLYKRVNQHNKGYSRYTKKLVPWILKYSEEFKTLSKVNNREYEVKGWKSRKAIEKLIKGPIV